MITDKGELEDRSNGNMIRKRELSVIVQFNFSMKSAPGVFNFRSSPPMRDWFQNIGPGGGDYPRYPVSSRPS
jgi:hypothetical protein